LENCVFAAEAPKLGMIDNIGRFFNSSHSNFWNLACSLGIHDPALQIMRYDRRDKKKLG